MTIWFQKQRYSEVPVCCRYSQCRPIISKLRPNYQVVLKQSLVSVDWDGQPVNFASILPVLSVQAYIVLEPSIGLSATQTSNPRPAHDWTNKFSSLDMFVTRPCCWNINISYEGIKDGMLMWCRLVLAEKHMSQSAFGVGKSILRHLGVSTMSQIHPR